MLTPLISPVAIGWLMDCKGQAVRSTEAIQMYGFHVLQTRTQVIFDCQF